jgi:hypothetical protein
MENFKLLHVMLAMPVEGDVHVLPSMHTMAI